MYKKHIYKVSENKQIAKDTFLMTLCGDASDITAPGQFINIKIDGFFLRRPISVSSYDKNSVTIIYKVVGNGTEVLSKTEIGAELDVLTGLGNGFDSSKSGNAPLLIGGGLGAAPLYELAKKLVGEGKKPSVILGFNTESEVVLYDELCALGATVYVATVDGSVGKKGFPTDVMRELEYTYFYTCGPEVMLKAVYDASKTSGELSFEERMGCGFGACMGCTCKTKYGNKRICKDGPVLVKEEVIW